jgi:hypothetical protein
VLSARATPPRIALASPSPPPSHRRLARASHHRIAPSFGRRSSTNARGRRRKVNAHIASDIAARQPQRNAPRVDVHDVPLVDASRVAMRGAIRAVAAPRARRRRARCEANRDDARRRRRRRRGTIIIVAARVARRARRGAARGRG